MRNEELSFFSGGSAIAASLKLPEDTGSPWPAVVHGPGWLGLKDAAMYRRYHAALTAAGVAVLTFDYRGFGRSEGNPQLLSPRLQLEDLISAVTYLTTRGDVDPERIGAFGSGGTGGGNVFLLAAADPRVRAVVSQVPVCDGRDWLHRMRSEPEWLAFLDELCRDRVQRVLTGTGRLVDPREEIMIPTPERRQTTLKQDVDTKVGRLVSLHSAEEILHYRPIDAARGLTTPAMIVAVEDDATTPTDHAVTLYEALAGPRQLVLQRNTTHYAAYERFGDQIAPMIANWFSRHLIGGTLVVRSVDQPGEPEQILVLE